MLPSEPCNRGKFFTKEILENEHFMDHGIKTWESHDHIIKTLTFSLPDIDECARQMDTCTSSQRCENTEGSFVCRRLTGCGTGYTLDEGTQSCIGK